MRREGRKVGKNEQVLTAGKNKQSVKRVRKTAVYYGVSFSTT